MKSLHEQLTGKPAEKRDQRRRPDFQPPNDLNMAEHDPMGLDGAFSSKLPAEEAQAPIKKTAPSKAASAEPSSASRKPEQPQSQSKQKNESKQPSKPKGKRPKKALGRSKGHQNLKPVLRNRFELKRKLGAGGMGTIYKAVDLIMVEANDKNPFLAIKILREELKNNPEAFKALQREYRKALKLAHPNIVQVYDFDRDDDLIYMTMEYLEGKDLEKVLRKFRERGLPFNKAFSIIEGISDALIHAHQHNYIHYDFKPGNIFITSHGIAKVFDFGISRAVKQKFKPVGDETCFEPKTFTALTPTYASPEMINGETPDTRDDIYALAVVSYEILAGVHPFGRMPAIEAWEQGLQPERIQGLTNKQWQTLKCALAFERDERLPTVEAFREGMLDTVPMKQIYRRALFGLGFLVVAALQVIAIALGGEGDDDVEPKEAAAPSVFSSTPTVSPSLSLMEHATPVQARDVVDAHALESSVTDQVADSPLSVFGRFTLFRR